MWIAIVHEDMASISSSSDGRTIVVSASSCALSLEDEVDIDRAGLRHRAWYGPEKDNCFFNRGPKQQFAEHIAQILREAALEDAYDGLIVIAAPEIETELRRVLSPEIRAKLVGDVIRNTPLSATSEPPCSDRVCH
jgi:protein required for attachment to host cells